MRLHTLQCFTTGASLMGAMSKEMNPLVISNSLCRHSMFILKKNHN